jgi:hypothetical protein
MYVPRIRAGGGLKTFAKMTSRTTPAHMMAKRIVSARIMAAV